MSGIFLRPARAVRVLLALGAAAFVPACSPEPPPPDDLPPDSVVAPPPGRTYERAIVFSTTRGDSTLLAAWRFASTARPGGVDRSARGWLLRTGVWEAFHDEAWESPPTAVPWRLLPRGPLRLIVGLDDALERVAFLDGARRLEVALGAPLGEWSGARGTVAQMSEASLRIGDGATSGIALDLNRVRETSEGPGGDWLFLVSGDSLQVLVERGLASDTLVGTGGWQGWARLDFRDIDVSTPVLEVLDERPFEPARRDVPVAFSIRSLDSGFEADLEAASFEIAAREGSGPVLPVDGMLELTGSLTLEGRVFEVRGIYALTRDDAPLP